MKIKLLFAPTLIVLIIVILIWWAYPDYTNGVDGIKELREKIVEEQGRLDALMEKASNAERLAGMLAAAPDKQDVLKTFIPESPQEEGIFDNLNYLGKNGEAGVLEINVEKSKVAPAPPAAPATMGDAGKELKGGQSDGALNFAAPEIKANNLNSTFSFVGNYETTKNLLAKLFALKRYNKVVSATMATLPKDSASPGGQAAAAEAPVDMLITSLQLEFNTFKKITSVTEADIELFANPAFDMSAISEISNRKTVDMMPLEVGPVSKLNPFL